MGTLWSDTRLWPTELDQESPAISQAPIPQERRSRGRSAESNSNKKKFALAAATIITILVSAIYLVCRYLLFRSG